MLSASAVANVADAQVATSKRSSAKPTAVSIAPASTHPYAPGIDAQQYDVAIRLPERGGAISATSVLTLQRAMTVTALTLDLIALTVDEVLVNDQVRTVVRDSNTIRIPLEPGDGSTVRVSVRYHGTPSDGLIIREDAERGWSGFGDNWPNRARYWLPTIDHPSDKARINWHVTAPASRAVVANGLQVSRTVLPRANSDSTTWAVTTFRMAQPIPTYLMVIGVAPLTETSLGNTACGAAVGGGCVPQSVWTFAPEVPTMPGNFKEAGAIVAFYAKKVGPFAYARLSHVQSATRFGGMENATAIFYSDNAFRKNSVGVSLIAHETAHQWFGDAVTPRRWPDLWLSEGFATYFDALYTEHSRGDSAFRAQLTRIRETVINAPIVLERPVVDSVGASEPLTLLNRNSYEKGGFVLHMLRRTLGDRVFFDALREYQRRYRNGTAITDELRTVFEQYAHRSLRDFFAQWLHRPGYADLTISYNWQPARHTLVLQVTQSDRFAPFALPLTFAIREANGRETLVRADIKALTSQIVRVRAPTVKDVASVVVDPHVDALARVTVLRVER